jgi:hypothetical protein
MTGMPASGPMSPNPKTAVPSVITGTVFQRRVSSKLFSASLCIAMHGSATPGVYASESASLLSTGTRQTVSILPFHCACLIKDCSL